MLKAGIYRFMQIIDFRIKRRKPIIEKVLKIRQFRAGCFKTIFSDAVKLIDIAVKFIQSLGYLCTDIVDCPQIIKFFHLRFYVVPIISLKLPKIVAI